MSRGSLEKSARGSLRHFNMVRVQVGLIALVHLRVGILDVRRAGVLRLRPQHL